MRAEVGVRYHVIGALAPGVVRRRGALRAFDVTVSAAVGVDAVFATYPDGASYGFHVEDHGFRWGFNPSLGAGFVW